MQDMKKREKEERGRGGEGTVPLVTHANMKELCHCGSESSFAIAAARTKTLRAVVSCSGDGVALSHVCQGRENTRGNTTVV